jgi:DNA-binding XRE family transcriptional regulator
MLTPQVTKFKQKIILGLQLRPEGCIINSKGTERRIKMETELMKRMGKKLRMRRVEADMRQNKLADKLGCHYAQLSSWERGKKTIPLKHLVKIPGLLKCSLDDLNPLPLQKQKV